MRMALAVAAALAALATSSPVTAVSGIPTAGTPLRGEFAGQIAIGGGRELYLRCKGTGRPTVILESGFHDSSDPWTLTDTRRPVLGSPAVFSGVARFTHVCRYDRPGTIRYTNPIELTTRSSPVPMPRVLPSMVSDLHALLRKAGIRGPYLLVGHSFGGMIVRLFAQTYPSEAAGLVFVDAFGTNIRELFGPDLWSSYVALLNQPGTSLDTDAGFERIDVDGAIDSILRAPPLPRIPLAVMSKTEPFQTAPGVSEAILTKLEQVWPPVQDELVTLEPQSPHILATGSDHYVQIHDPDLTIKAIELIFDRVTRAGTRGLNSR